MAQSVSRAVVLIVVSLAIGFLAVPARGADPASGTVSPTNLSTAWAGQHYALAATTLPEQCPPAADPLNVLCDHFFLTVDVPSDFWNKHTGQVTIRIEWPSSDNDFDLYVYDPGGGLAGSSAAGGTTREEVALLAPQPGQYEVRVVPFLIIDSGYNGQAELFFTPGGPTPNPIRPTGGIVFAPSVIVDSQRTEGEPVVHVDQSGTIWESGPWGTTTQNSFVHKSVDAGDSYHIDSVGLRPDPPPGGGDTDIVTDDQGFAYFVDLESLVNLGVAVSNDGGNSWRKNPVGVQSSGDDRQWFAVDNGPTSGAGDNTVFLTFRQVGSGLRVFSTPGSTGPTDNIGGIVYQDAANAPTGVTDDATCGQTRFDSVNRNLYLVCLLGAHIEAVRGHVNPSQRTDIPFQVLALPASPGGTVGDIFPGVAVDAAGIVYGTWVDEANHNVYVSASQDQGATWTAPLQVNGNPANTNVWVWAAAGARGILDLVWYGTAVRGDPDAFPSWYNSRQAATTIPWFTYFAQVNFDFANPTASVVYQVRASEHASHFGQICQGGIGCTVSNGDRSMADFLAVAIDGAGAAHIVYDDTTNQHHGAAVFAAKQIAGPGALGKKIRGTAPVNPMSDRTGDAQYPHYSPAGPGPNHPQMDFTRVALSQPDSDHLQVTMNVANAASLAPPTGASSIIWLSRWQSSAVGDEGEPSFRLFYAGAKSVAGGTPSFFSGTGTSANGPVPGNGCITTTPENCKAILYPQEKAQSGSFDQGTGTIVIQVPLADVGFPAKGTVLFSVTALSLGEIAGDPLLQDVDATRAFDFVIGGATAPVPRKVTGAGAISTDSSGGEGHFNLVAHTNNKGKVDYFDDASGLTFASAFISSVSVEGTKATIKGTGFVDGTFTDFVVVVEDLGEPGAGSDTFSITLGTGYSRSGVLLRGNLQIH
jgi:pre-peptidase